MQKISHGVAVLLLAIFLVPQVSAAAPLVTERTARLGENVFLYTITYKFGFEKYDVHLPIAAVRHASADDTTVIGYDILNKKLRTTIGTTKAIVLSDAKVEGNEYVVSKGETAEFTLVTFLMIPEDKIASTSNYSLKVSSLPFTMVGDDLEVQGYLNKSELRSFVTKSKNP